MLNVLTNINGWLYVGLAAALCVATFGFYGFLTLIASLLFFVLGALLVLLRHGWERSEELLQEFENLDARFPIGIPQFLKKPDKHERSVPYETLTGSPLLDPILEEIVGFTLRDFLESWYSALTNDEQFKESLRGSAYRTLAVLAANLREVDWTPVLTRQIVDDFASHIRLYRKAKDKVQSELELENNEEKSSQSDIEGKLESHFFDMEKDMENSYCRDLVSTSSQYENAYLHDLADILLYLLIPPEDFRCLPLRFLIREVLVKRLLLPVLDLFSDPDFVNQTIAWLLSEVPVNCDDFLSILEAGDNAEELVAVRESLDEEIGLLRAKDTGGDDDTVVKQQLNSLYFVRRIVETRIKRVIGGGDGSEFFEEEEKQETKRVELPLTFILTNGISVSYFIDFLVTVGGQSYIDLWLAIEGFKVSVDHQLSSAHLNRVTRGETIDPEVLETIREAALSLYKQYLSEEALERVQLDEGSVKNLLQRIKTDTPSENWFDQIQTKILEILDRDLRFYPAFLRNPLYTRMLADMNLMTRMSSSDDLDISNAEEAFDAMSVCSAMSFDSAESKISCISSDEIPTVHAHIITVGIGHEGNHAFALYKIEVTRDNAKGEHLSSWHVYRRYSDFHILNNIIENRFPNVAKISFPGKKTFNNLNQDFLEKRKRSLNSYLRSLLHPEILRSNKELEQIMINFLCQKTYTGEKGALSKKVMSFVNPIRTSVRAFGDVVTSVPETVFDGVVRMGDGIGKVTKSMLGAASGNPMPQPSESIQFESSRVGASLTADVSDNIPLRIMLLFMDEVFGLRQRNQWFRRRLVAFLRQLLHAALGSSINKKIVDFVVWLTSEEQAAEYLKAFRNSFWPNGQLAESTPERPHHIQMRARVVAKVKMLAALPDELRLFIGNETSRNGIHLVFEALQNPHLNRRLLYVMLERLLVTVFPKNRFEQILPRLHAKSPRCQQSKS